ncbi:HlyD family secretion protein [Pseudomonas eucalypticola]|uniref:HlyD family secretion protein n=2 Tax=Pseudomonas TaxID=286 RepID=A0A7D5D7E6_9PSED|nr:HlyD family secretion protein [Pseudomonas eucalypticola]QKZ04652.1 HlyD family secretion protein [Pseudomonas eucalypticola]
MSVDRPLGQQERLSPVAEPPDEPRRAGPRKVLLGLGLLIVLAGLVWGGYWLLHGRFIESTDDAYLQADSMTVAPKVGGYVTEVLVADNQTVSVGQPLVRLDVRKYQAALDEALATVTSRQADVAKAEADLVQQDASIAQARAELAGADADTRHARSEVARYAPLAKSGAETEERLAELNNKLAQASTSQTARQAAVQSAQTRVGILKAQLQQARAQLVVAEASARQSQLDRDDTTVVSTLAGRVADRSVRVGQFTQPGTRLLTVVPVRALYLTANFKETQIGHMRPGQQVTVHVDALPGQDLVGHIDSLSPGTGSQFALLPSQNATGNFTKIVQRVPVRIHLDVPDGVRNVLVPGLSVTVDVDVRSHG